MAAKTNETFMSFEFTEKIMSDLSVTKNMICPKCVVAECLGLLICVYKIKNRCKYQIPTKKIYKCDLPTKEILKSLYNLPFQSIMNVTCMVLSCVNISMRKVIFANAIFNFHSSFSTKPFKSFWTFKNPSFTWIDEKKGKD